MPNETATPTRHTRQRNQILTVLRQNSETHLTAEQITAALKTQGVPVGHATVYRFLKQLEESGAVKRYTLADNAACYQWVGENSGCNEHYHLLCNRCGGVTHIESELLSHFKQDVQTDYRFAIDERKTVFYGQCGACAETGGLRP